MNDWKLPIRDIIEQIGKEPVFIIAKTGVGKTVTVPTKVLLGLCDDLLRSGADLARPFSTGLRGRAANPNLHHDNGRDERRLPGLCRISYDK